MSLLIVGSVAYDCVKTPFGEVKESLGGSATFFSAAATHFSPVKIVGVVGDDFNLKEYDFLKKRGADLSGLQIVGGKTFRWEGEYTGDMNEARTISTALNVFETFSPNLSEDYRKSRFVFLGNIDPDLQINVLQQVKSPKFVALDTMNLWIGIKQDSLKRAISMVDMLILNNKEAMELSKTDNIVAASKILQALGPKIIIIKKGEHGSLLRYGSNIVVLPAYPLDKVFDPTGAGDSFAGGVMGYLAKRNDTSFNTLKKAIVYGTLMASFNVEAFSVQKLKNLTKAQLNGRYKSYLKVFKI